MCQLLMMATNGRKAWKSKAMGCICVVGESDTVAMVMQPFDDSVSSSPCVAFPNVMVVFPEHKQ